jgi:hypothetical protein
MLFYGRSCNYAPGTYRKSRVERLSTDEAQLPTTKSDGMWFFQQRLEHMGLNRTRIAGEEYGLRFGGVQWAILGERGNAPFVRTQFASADDAWRVCMWHKNRFCRNFHLRPFEV